MESSQVSLLPQRVQKTPPQILGLYHSYGLFQAGASAADVLILVFVARLLETTPRELGFLDGLSTFGNLFAALGFGLLAGRIVPARPILAGSLLAAALSILLFATSTNMGMAYALALIVGVFTAVPNSVVPWYVSSKTSRSEWAEAYRRLATAGALGGVIGFALSLAWLFVAQQWPHVKFSEQALFLFWGVATLLAAAGSWHAASRGPSKTRRPTPGVFQAGGGLLPGTAELDQNLRSRKEQHPAPSPASGIALRDVWIVHSLVPALLFVGLGMSFTGTLLYLLEGMASPGPLLFALVLLFRIAAWLTSAGAQSLLSHFSPLRVSQMSGVWRILAVVGLSLVFLLPKSMWSMPLVAVMFAVSGAAGGIITITGVLTATQLVAKRYHGTAIFLFNGVSSVGAGIGAWLAGAVGQELHFPAVLAISGLLMGAALWLQHRY